jgi:hypothetical protein
LAIAPNQWVRLNPPPAANSGPSLVYRGFKR